MEASALGQERMMLEGWRARKSDVINCRRIGFRETARETGQKTYRREKLKVGGWKPVNAGSKKGRRRIIMKTKKNNVDEVAARYLSSNITQVVGLQ
jgi:hypothetical protein